MGHCARKPNMEKYSQFRDRGSGIAPFFPVSSTHTGIYFPVYVFLFLFKLPFFITVATTYFIFLQRFPLGSLFKKAILWMILGIPGIWWIDLQIDGVKKGSLAKKHQGRVPQPSDIIASSFTSPIDSLYLAAIFDPIFTVSYPHTRQVQYISLFGAILRALSQPQEYPPKGAKMTDLKTLVAEHPKRVIVVFPECTTTNGKGILPFSPSLLLAPPTTKIFPISLRYSLRISPRLYRDNIGHSYGIYFHSQLTAFECELRRLCITHPSPQIQLPRRGIVT